MTEHELRVRAAITALVLECDTLGLTPPSTEVILEECRRARVDPLDTIHKMRWRNLNEAPWPADG